MRDTVEASSRESTLGLSSGLLGLDFCLLLGRLLGLALGGIGGAGGGLGLRVGRLGRGPQGEVVAQQLHDERAVAVRLLRERVKLGDGVVESLLGQVAGTVGRVQDFVVEDREVESQTEADGVGRGELRLGDVGGALYFEQPR